MLRLAQRLAVLEPHNLGAWPAAADAARQNEVLNGRTTDNWEAWCAAAQRERQRFCDAIRQQARSCTSIMLDNVAEYVAENCRCMSKDNGDVTQPVADTSKVLQMFHSGLSIRPPFERCLLEWNAPRYWDKGENRMEAGISMTAMQCGAWCSYTEQSADMRDTFEQLWQRKHRLVNTRLAEDRYTEEGVVAAKQFLENTQPPTARLHGCLVLQPMYVYVDDNRLRMLGAHEHIYLDQQGRPLLAGYHEHAVVGVRKYVVSIAPLMINTVATVGLAYMNIKNVENVDVTAATNAEMLADMPPRKKWQPKRELPPVRYRTINILPMGGARKAAAATDDPQGGRARHICRGHMATYTEERPLFGKYVGTYWIPAHVRGDKKHGEVIKNYSVQPIPMQTTQAGET